MPLRTPLEQYCPVEHDYRSLSTDLFALHMEKEDKLGRDSLDAVNWHVNAKAFR